MEETLQISELVKLRIEKLTKTLERLATLVTDDLSKEELAAIMGMRLSAELLCTQMVKALTEEPIDKNALLKLINMSDTLYEEVSAI